MMEICKHMVVWAVSKFCLVRIESSPMSDVYFIFFLSSVVTMCDLSMSDTKNCLLLMIPLRIFFKTQKAFVQIKALDNSVTKFTACE